MYSREFSAVFVFSIGGEVYQSTHRPSEWLVDLEGVVYTPNGVTNEPLGVIVPFKEVEDVLVEEIKACSYILKNR